MDDSSDAEDENNDLSFEEKYLRSIVPDRTRPRGMLSEVDRDFLVGARQYDHRQSRYDRQAAIRERVSNGLLDFLTMSAAADDEMLKKLDRGAVREGVIGTISFLYRMAEISAESTSGALSPESIFETWLSVGVSKAISAAGPHRVSPINIQKAEVDFSVREPESIDPSKTEQTLCDEGIEALSQSELLFLLWLTKRQEIAGDRFTTATLEEVESELTDRVDSEWNLRGNVVLPPAAYSDDDEFDS